MNLWVIRDGVGGGRQGFYSFRCLSSTLVGVRKGKPGSCLVGGLLSCQAEVLQGLLLISKGYQCFSISSLGQAIFRILYKGVLTGCNCPLWITSLQGAIRQGMPVGRQEPGW